MVEKIKTPERHESMRGWFAYELHKQMMKNEKIWLVTADLGYGMFDKIKRDFPDRFLNTGAAEQAAMGVAVGMTYKGFLPVVYSITPFLLYRPFETIRNYVAKENLPMILVGGGRNKDYAHDGFSHWSEEDKEVISLFPAITPFWPEDKSEIPDLLEKMINNPKPYYLNLVR
jgi:transketolase